MSILPQISVIMPAYNAEKWLAESCESVFRQTYSNIELIVVDDGSVDATYDLAMKLADSDQRMRVIHTENGGVCRARNIGIRAATGEYIAFLDADDVLTKHALECLFSAISKEGADIAIGWKSNMTSSGEHIGCPYERITGVFSGTEGLKLSLEDHPAMYAVWGKLYKRTAIGDIRFVEGKKVHEDSFFVFECLLKQPRIVVCNDLVLHYRLSENSASRSDFSEKVFDILYFAERKHDIIKEYYPEFTALGENIIVKANMALLWNLLRTDDPKYTDIQKKAIKAVLDRRIYYRTAIKSDAKLFWILTHRLYGVYKMLYIIKRKFDLHSMK